MDLLNVIVDDFGGSPVAEHNYPCPIYSSEPAVYVLHKGYFKPSWKAQREGWRLVKANTWFRKLLLKLFKDGE